MSILKKTKKVLKQRAKEYPPYIVEAKRVALVWSGITGFDIPWRLVPLMMAGLKNVREASAPKEDNGVDAIGYLVRHYQITKK